MYHGTVVVHGIRQRIVHGIVIHDIIRIQVVHVQNVRNDITVHEQAQMIQDMHVEQENIMIKNDNHQQVHVKR